jgi:hypothetical protein
MRGIYLNPIARRRRPQAVVSVDSGFVLILVLPVAMLLLMTALSLVSRSNSAAVASSQESRAQAARMAAEYGLNALMARINTEYNCATPLSTSNTVIPGSSPSASYTITSPLNLCGSTVALCTDTAYTDLPVTIRGILTVDSSTTYTQEIRRTLSICNSDVSPTVSPTPFRVRAVRPRLV